jgi:hypothetical protein
MYARKGNQVKPVKEKKQETLLSDCILDHTLQSVKINTSCIKVRI